MVLYEIDHDVQIELMVTMDEDISKSDHPPKTSGKVFVDDPSFMEKVETLTRVLWQPDLPSFDCHVG